MYILRLTDWSQHVTGFGLFSLSGLRSCTPTSLSYAYRFLRLSQTNQLGLDEAFYQKHLKEGVARGISINAISGAPLSHKSVYEIQKLPPEVIGEIAALQPGQLIQCTMNPAKENVDFAIIGLSRALTIQLEGSDNVGISATCGGHTTLILKLNDLFYFIDSASNSFQSALEIHSDLESLTESLRATWGAKGDAIDLTPIRINPTLSPELLEPFDALIGLETIPVAARRPPSPAP